MTVTKHTITAVEIGPTIGIILNRLAEKNTKLTATKLQGMPRRFRNASLRFYYSVLKVRTGRLRKSFEEFARQVGTDTMEYGMRSDVNYAAIQHEGGHTAPHIILPKNKKALYWSGALHPVKQVNHPGSNITAKHFFSIPMVNVANEVIDELKKEIDF